MSNDIFPTLAGLDWNASRSPEFSTQAKRAVSGKELRGAFRQYPLWNFNLSYNVLRDDLENNELRALAGFFLVRKGMFDSFLYTWEADSTVTDQGFGIGDGVTTSFQLVRSFGGFVEPVQNVNAITSIKKAGAVQTNPANYTIDATGWVTFAAAPAAGAVLTWSGSYYYRVRFLIDAAEFSEFLQDLHELKKLSFVGSTVNKV